MNSAEGMPPEIPATLLEIVEHHRVLLESAVSTTPRPELEARARDSAPTRDFIGALTDRPTHPGFAVIAEIKRRSPSAGIIRPEWDREDFAPEDVARGYAIGGASAISCLTDEKFFGGDPRFIARVKESVDLPVLRKDFILDPYEVVRTRALGADAVLLIAECLDDDAIAACLDTAQDHELGVLLEIHHGSHLDRVLARLERSGARAILGINNRDLSRMVTDLNHTTDLLDRVPDRSRVVSESGIRTSADLRRLRDHGVGIALIGEHLMRKESPGEALRELLDGVVDQG